MKIIKQIIIKYLQFNEFNIGNVGALYIADSIEYICESENYRKILSNLDKNVYPIIAERHKVNIDTLKSDIIKATNKAYENACVKNINKMINKSTPKMIITKIVYVLKNQSKGVD